MPSGEKENVTVIIFGASGDLASKKTFPALFGLFAENLLPSSVRIVGYARSDLSSEKFISKLTSYLPKNASKAKLDEFIARSQYVRGQYDADKDFQHLDTVLRGIEKEDSSQGIPSRLFYLALPPSEFAPVGAKIKKHCYLTPEEGRFRVIIEKPFGHDLQSSRELQNKLAPLFNESEIYRIDHYLGKEMVKNLLILRFANLFFLRSWNALSISSVQITFKEPFGTEGRGGYFDNIGIIRDVMQNHLMQVLSITAMERPVSLAPEDIRDEKVKVLKCIDPVKIDNALLGQYSAANGKPGYLEDDSIQNKDSKTPTYAAMTLYIRNDRWDGVPFILKAGKALDEQKVEIRIQFKAVAPGLFTNIGRNELVVRVQPSEAVYVKLNQKYPGLETKPVISDLDLTYHQHFGNIKIPQAYEALILDCLKDDHSNFVRDDELDLAWKIFTPLLHKIDAGEVPVSSYPYGSRGPAEADEFVKKYGYVRTHADEQYSTRSRAMSAGSKF